MYLKKYFFCRKTEVTWKRTKLPTKPQNQHKQPKQEKKKKDQPPITK